MNIVTLFLVTLCIDIAYSTESVPKLNTPNVVLSSITNSSMVLHWYAPFNLEYTPTGYEIQYSKLGDDWKNVYGNIGSISEPQHEILWIEVKNPDNTPIDGTFRLYLNYYTRYEQPVHFITNEIKFDAKAADIKTELEHLTGITNVHVVEGVPKHNSIIEGKSSWIIVYDYRHDIIGGSKVPQLQVYDEKIDNNNERDDIPTTLKGDIQCVELYTGNGKELSGQFSLHINGHEISDLQVNITAEELENKLKGIFTDIKVERPNDYYSVLQYYGYNTDFQSWCITFSTEKPIIPILIHPPPGNNGLLRIVQKYGEYKVTNVQIHELRRQRSNDTLCFGDCYQLIDNLYPNSGYIYRLRYKIETEEWSDYTSSSQIYYTLQYGIPSHPVPPLFISSTKTSINVECILPNDNGAKITDITFEISDENDKSFMWRKAEVVKTARDFLHYTIIKLTSDSSYYIRVQMHNSAGASDYSNPSNLMKTQPDLPLEPPKLYVESDKTTTDSITLFWLPVKDNGIPVDSYSVQYKTQPFGYWNNIRYAVSAVNANIKREIQTIKCNIPIKEIESTDTFTLEFGYKYSVDSIKPNRYKTKPLSFKCTAEEMKNALNAIRPHSIYHIDRIIENSRYMWRIYFNYYQQSFTLPYPLLRLSDASFYASDEYSEVFEFMKIQEATPAVFKDILSLKVDGLTNYTTYIFRAKANTIEGSTQWSEPTKPETTKAITTLLPPERIPSVVIPTAPATGRYAANREDPDYIGGIGNGGNVYSKGENGLIVISTCKRHGHLIPKSYYYYKEVNNEPVVQKYIVKAPPGVNIDCLEIKAWGAGGGGSKNSTGGGGGFAFTQIKTKNNEEYDILVGEGGYPGLKEIGGSGGWPNGGKGGNGREAGAGGGGYSGVFYKGELVVIAGSGGGGGSTDHLSSNGGHGGGADGGDGDTPIIPIDKATGYAGYPPDYVHTDLEIYNTNNYDVLPGGGKAGTLYKGGDSGRQSSFQYGENVHYIDGKPLLEGETGSFHPPTAGYSLTGGIGGSSLEGGGGGGAGYYGGGGGGAGIDGAGGGGGGSYVNITHMYKDPEDTTPSQDPQDIKPTFYVIKIMCENITIGWNGAFIARNYPDVISVGIEFAVGLSTLNFTYVDVVPLLQSQFTVSGLIPMEIYRIRIFYVYRTLPISLYSDIVTFRTPLCRTNDWTELDPRPNINIKNESYRAPDYPIKAIPSPRRGHTLAVVDNYVYMFGGFTEGYNCEILHGYECYVGTDSKSYWVDDQGNIRALDTTNELWKLNPMAMIFEELVPENGTEVPPPRELHSASVVNNTIYIFGGRDGEEDNVGRNDFWALNIDTDEVRSFDYGNSTTLDEGKNVYTYIESSSNYTDNYCLSSINVTITINHPCVEELEIFLIKIANYQLDGAGLKRLRLWRSNNNGVCHNFTKVTFSDNGIDVSLLRKYENSIIKPIDLFSNFMNTHSSANFSLQIRDTVTNGNTGSLVDWSISISSHHCPFIFNWTKLNDDNGDNDKSVPQRRYGHASIVFGNSIYIYGGYSKGVLHDLWRYDIDKNKWTELTAPSDIHIPYSFRSMLVTPYNLMAYGGYSSTGYREVDQIDVLKRFTEEIEVTGNSTMNTKSHPVPRYMTSMVLTKSRYDEDQYIMYGGYDGIRIYGDLWALTLTEWGNKRAELAKSYLDDHCRLLDSSLRLIEHWSNSCASDNATEICNPYDILDYAFCKNIYQSIGFL